MKKSIIAVCVLCVLGIAAFAAVTNFSSTTIQIGMIVSDLDESMAFYRDVVGMVQVDPKSFDVGADFGKRSGLTDSLPIHVEIFKLGSGDQATQLKMMTFGDRAKPQKNEYLHSHTGIQYITIRVNNLTPIVKRIKKHGIDFTGETPIPLGNQHFVMIQDPDGTFVELIGPMK